MSRKDIDLICLGEAMIEFTRVPKNGTGPCYVQGLGGDTSNCAIAAARQGARVAYLSAVGDDRFGHIALESWKSENIDISEVSVDPIFPTGIYFIEPLKEGRDFTYYRKGSAASNMTPASLNNDLLGRASVLHLSSISQAISKTANLTCSHAINIAKSQNTQIAYDINLRLNLWDLDEARETINATINKADILLPSLDEARVLTELHAKKDIIEFYLSFDPEILVLKCGGDGIIIAVGDQVETIPALKANVMDASGAGDTFDGAFLACISNGWHPIDAARYAVIAAGLSVEGYGAVTPIPNKELVLKRMKIEGIEAIN